MRLLLGLLAATAWLQATSFVGTLESIKPETLELTIRRDDGVAVVAVLSPGTAVLRIAPGITDLKQAFPMPSTELAKGDRVLITPMPEGNVLRRLVVMSAKEIGKHHDAQKEDWTRRGLFGTVTSKHADSVTLQVREGGSTEAKSIHVSIPANAKVRRYRPDSVRFSDAVESPLSEVKNGDQMRVRGEKSADAKTMTADEAVFGTFATLAAQVQSIDADTKTIRAVDSITRKPVDIRLTADSQIKRMPEFKPGGMMPPMPGGGMPGGMAMPNPVQMLERMPPAKLADLKPGETVIVSATVGATKNQVTAITLIGNAEMILNMLAMQQQQQKMGGPGVSPLDMMGGGLTAMMP
jgi:hypothetical protein